MAKHPDGLTDGEARVLVGAILTDDPEEITEWLVCARVRMCENAPIPHTHAVHAEMSVGRAICLLTDAAEVLVKCSVGDEFED